MPASNPENSLPNEHVFDVLKSSTEEFSVQIPPEMLGNDDSSALRAFLRRYQKGSQGDFKSTPTSPFHRSHIFSPGVSDQFGASTPQIEDFGSYGSPDTNPNFYIYHSKVCPPAPEGSHALAEQLLDRRPSTDPTSEE